MKLREFLDYWLENVVRGNVRTSTYTIYSGYVCKHINPLIGEEELTSLKTEIVQGFVKKLMGKLAPKTISAIATMLKGALECAIEYEYFVKNPCAKIRLPRSKEKVIKIFSHAEQEKLEKAIFNSTDNRYVGILICLYTGIRIGELCALKWENLDSRKRQLHIQLSLNRVRNYDNSSEKAKTKLVFEEPKTDKSKRLLPIPKFLCSILNEQKKEKQ